MEKHILHIILLDISTVCVYVWYSQDFHFCGWVSVYVHTFCAKQVVGHDHFKFVLVNKTITTKFTYKQLLISYIYKLSSSWRLRPSSIPVNPSDHLTSSDTIATMSGTMYCIIEKKTLLHNFQSFNNFLGSQSKHQLRKVLFCPGTIPLKTNKLLAYFYSFSYSLHIYPNEKHWMLDYVKNLWGFSFITTIIIRIWENLTMYS